MTKRITMCDMYLMDVVVRMQLIQFSVKFLSLKKKYFSAQVNLWMTWQSWEPKWGWGRPREALPGIPFFSTWRPPGRWNQSILLKKTHNYLPYIWSSVADLQVASVFQNPLILEKSWAPIVTLYSQYCAIPLLLDFHMCDMHESVMIKAPLFKNVNRPKFGVEFHQEVVGISLSKHLKMPISIWRSEF